MEALKGTAPALLVGALLLAGLAVPATPHRPDASGPQVLALYQSPANITEQSAMTVALQVADPVGIAHVWFTFCQLTSSVCYLPITMNPQPGNWNVGTTYPMTDYSGM